MKKVLIYLSLCCLALFAAFLMPARSIAAKQVLISRGGSINSMDNLIAFPAGPVVTAMEIQAASWETGYDTGDYLVYDPLTHICSLYQDTRLAPLPDLAAIEDALESNPFMICDVVAEIETAPADITDSDGDGTPDTDDQCPYDPHKTEPGECGCGTADTDADTDGVVTCDDCDDTNPEIYPGASEVCNNFDDDCDGLVDEENAANCAIYYKDEDEDDYGGNESRCLCAPKGIYRATQGGDPDDRDPNVIPGSPITVKMDLAAGWNMLSLPVTPGSLVVGGLFSGATAIYGYERGIGYHRLTGADAMEVGKGYWVLLDEARSYALTGQPIQLNTNTIEENGWMMIGGCTSPAEVSSTGCTIRVIYRYIPGAGYQRVLESEHLEPGKGYWILLEDVDDQAVISIEKLH